MNEFRKVGGIYILKNSLKKNINCEYLHIHTLINSRIKFS